MGKPIAHLSDLTPDPKNARAHNPRNVGLIESALNEVGAARSIVIDEDGGVAGNATIEAAAQAGIERVQVVEADGETIIAVRRRGLTPEQKVKLALFDNRAAELAEWDAGVLAGLAEEIDLSQLFRDEELSELLAGVGAPDVGGAGDDDTPPAIDEDKPTRVQPGDVWRVGEHLVCCLDSTDKANVKRIVALANGPPSFVVADPPYGVKAVGKDGRIGSDYSDNKTPGYERFKGYSANVYVPVIGDETTDTAVNAALLALDLYPKATQVWWGANHYAQALPPSPCWVVWDKENDGDDFPDAELAWVGHKGAVRIFRHMWKGMLRASEVNEKRVHPTQKPVALFTWLYERYGKPDDLILDPFLGSGPSLKAAHRMGDRRVVGFELSPHYCDHILEWASAAGLTCTQVGE